MQAYSAFINDRTNISSSIDREYARKTKDLIDELVASKPVRFKHEHWLQSIEIHNELYKRISPSDELMSDIELVMQVLAQRSKREMRIECSSGYVIDLSKRTLIRLMLHNADLSRINLSFANLSLSKLWCARFFHTYMPGVNFSLADLNGANFEHADLRRANFMGAKLIGASFRNAGLGLVDLASENLWQGQLFPTRFAWGHLSGADFRDSELGRADFRRAIMTGAKMDHADLRRADLRGADLAGASLVGANVGRANLEGANLSNTKFTSGSENSTTVTQEQLDKAKAWPGNPPLIEGIIDPSTGIPLVWRGKVPDGDLPMEFGGTGGIDHFPSVV